MVGNSSMVGPGSPDVDLGLVAYLKRHLRRPTPEDDDMCRRETLTLCGVETVPIPEGAVLWSESDWMLDFEELEAPGELLDRWPELTIDDFDRAVDSAVREME